MNLKSLSRHAASYAVGFLIATAAKLLGHALPADIQASLQGLIDPLAVVIGGIAAIATKAAIEKFPFLSFLSDNSPGGESNKPTNGSSVWAFCLCCTLLTLMGGLTACSTTVTTAADGTRSETRSYDPEAANPILELMHELFVQAPSAVPVIPADAK